MDLKSNFFATSLSVSINLVLIGLKLSIGFIFSSISLIADGFDSLLDIITAAFAGIGEHMSRKPPDKEHPFGHEKYQLLFSIAIALTLFFSAYLIAQDAIERLIHKEGLVFSWLILVVVCISIIGKLVLSVVLLYIGKRINSPVLIANAKNYRTDVFSSVFVGVALIGAYFNVWWLDPICAFIIVLLIFYTGFEIIKFSLPELLDRAPPEEIIERVKEIAMGNPAVKEVHIIRLRSILGTYTGDFHLLVDPNLSIAEAHEIAEETKAKIENEREFKNILIHIEPFTPEELLESVKPR